MGIICDPSHEERRKTKKNNGKERGNNKQRNKKEFRYPLFLVPFSSERQNLGQPFEMDYNALYRSIPKAQNETIFMF
jgi:hypothetical protein